MADQEMSLADVIVGKATSVPTASSANIKTRGLMAQAVDKAASAPIPTDPMELLPTYIGDMIRTIREERRPISSSSTPDFFEENIQITAEDDLAATEEAVQLQADRMIDSAVTQYDYSSGEKPPVPKTPELKDAIAKAKSIVEKRIGITGKMWDTYRDKVGFIESSNTYNKIGGSGDHYDGYYQMGEKAKADAGKILGYDIAHDAASRLEFRNDPALQEEAVAAYTAQNHKYLTNSSSKYRALPIEEKLAVLGYAHNQGWKGARDWLNSGVVGSDAFGTKGTKYYNALIDAF